uniref:Uncharacterized protein n=1 Tax=Anguilla anguilla TaxID=7936 RepID=A0A0E9W1V4_ANGAN
MYLIYKNTYLRNIDVINSKNLEFLK